MAGDTLLDQLYAFLRIPSISSGGGDPADLQRAAEWVAERVVEAGGRAGVVQTPGNPLAVGELRAARADAPTVMIYGHYDVQSPDPVEAWTTPPFEPVVRDGRLYARGACDDKGNFFPLLYVACELARAGELPVHVRVLSEGEEEIGGHHACDWIAEDERGADCCIVFDSGMHDERTPEICLGVRGLVQLALHVRAQPRDLHSGLYGGVALNAVQALTTILQAVLPGPDGRLRDELRAGAAAPAAAELAAWARLRVDGPGVLAEVGATEIAPGAADELYVRTWADTSLDVNGFSGGDALQPRTIVPAEARAIISQRLAPGQDAATARDVLERLLREAAPPGAELTIVRHGLAEAAAFDPESPALRLAAGAIERTCGAPPVFTRSGGTIAALAAFAARDIPTVLTGFSLAADAFHAPDESYRLESLRLGELAARELYASLATLR